MKTSVKFLEIPTCGSRLRLIAAVLILKTRFFSEISQIHPFPLTFKNFPANPLFEIHPTKRDFSKQIITLAEIKEKERKRHLSINCWRKCAKATTQRIAPNGTIRKTKNIPLPLDSYFQKWKNLNKLYSWKSLGKRKVITGYLKNYPIFERITRLRKIETRKYTLQLR